MGRDSKVLRRERRSPCPALRTSISIRRRCETEFKHQQVERLYLFSSNENHSYLIHPTIREQTEVRLRKGSIIFKALGGSHLKALSITWFNSFSASKNCVTSVLRRSEHCVVPGWVWGYLAVLYSIRFPAGTLRALRMSFYRSTELELLFLCHCIRFFLFCFRFASTYSPRYGIVALVVLVQKQQK